MIITPLGAPVEPEVYWRKASVSRLAPGSDQLSGDGPSSPPSSVMRQGMPRSSGMASCQRGASLRCETHVRMTEGRESLTIELNLVDGRRTLGTFVGIATTPAYRHPKKAVMNSSPGGYRRRRAESLTPCPAAAPRSSWPRRRALAGSGDRGYQSPHRGGMQRERLRALQPYDALPLRPSWGRSAPFPGFAPHVRRPRPSVS